MRLHRRQQEYIWVILWLLRLLVSALVVSRRTIIARLRSPRSAATVPAGGRSSRERSTSPPPTAPDGPLQSHDFRQINEPGFGDRWNTYPWSMQWWRGQLYVGTNRAFPCVEYLQVHAQVPWLQRYPPRSDPDIPCADSPYDLPLQAELWRYTPDLDSWDRVYQSPRDVRVPLQPDASIARDIGYRNMLVFEEPDGTEALYVACVGARPITRGAHLPRLLRTTDGHSFSALPSAPGTTLGDLEAGGFRAMATFEQRLYVVAGNLYGCGVVLEATDPRGGNDCFRCVSPPGMLVNEMVPFNGFLYVGLRHPLRGYAVMKTAANGAPPYTFESVVPFGAYRKVLPSHCVLSMCIFNERLYIGTSNPAEVLCIYPDDRWDLIVGKPRRTPWGMKYPLSGMGDGFDDPLNVNISRMQVHEGWLYAGTFNVASKQRNLPIVGALNRSHMGFDLLATRDGIHFTAITRTGLDDAANTVRTFASTPLGLFLGANEEYRGARVYLGRRISD